MTVGSSLVEPAGETLAEIVAVVKRATDIVREISTAAEEPSGGIEQVNQAVKEMDRGYAAECRAR